jgi:CRISPR-associated protein (TIGR03986 family)
MAEGTIKRWFPDNRNPYGYIIPDEDGEDVRFYGDNLVGASQSQIVEGARVEYELRRNAKRPTTHRFWLIGTEEPKSKKASWSRKQYSSGYVFLNPYNFIRYLDTPKVDQDTSTDQQLLWRCPPPPHDRYLGLSGQITCEVEAMTPLFVSDSHAIEKGENDHDSYRFFEYDGKPALPASSLRGMVRSVFEAVTNSCFGVHDDQKLSKHFESRRAPWLVPARVEKEGTEWCLRLLPGSTKLQIERRPGGGSPDGMQYAAWAASYWPISPSKTLRAIDPKRFRLGGKQRRIRDKFIKRTKTAFRNPDGVKHGEPCYAMLHEFQHPHPKVKFWDVVEVRRCLEDFPDNQQSDATEGWLCINNQNIEAKHSERFFFSRENSRVIDLPETVREEYEALIKDYQRRHAKTVDKHKQGKRSADEASLSRFIYDDEESRLQGGELVYALLSGTISNPTIEFIAPVAVPRISYSHSVGDLLLQYPHLLPCKDYAKLCPACRTFGWVHPKPPEGSPDIVTACAGRVRFSHARHLSDNGTLEDTPLAVLSTPKPTTTQFYLLDENGNPHPEVDYNKRGAQLRGRKVYRHHGEADPKEYEYQGKEPSDQHRTVRGALKPGARFEFTVDFENLMPVELDALLYALELEDDLVHRLGYAKPLGFGSIKVRVSSLKALNWTERFGSIALEAGWQEAETEQEIKRRKACFLTQMKGLYGAEAFDTILADLHALLGSPPEGLPIHYPRPKEELDIENHPQFEWFVGNKKRVEGWPKGKIDYPPVTLPKADEDGLPLIDAKGEPGH